ncbi:MULTISPECIES: peptidoglycan D,D-transpeptidase FtsI family protein [unclassified Romboutsia]|uniref:peptidoglycan D,D-transpeptidase FtsI family protein n=1 Tax=unclassified Romboutsia TaxID=2626894 RepID=UPI001898C2D2|nr:MULTISPECIES: penicillin-binding protein 2 [unclassified Romboutsia]MDB8804497.1 penicillin-binding protein 2 [Romboutsia sp. 1001216sp1]MDB8806579.1 penicillin-binding protein 2 [Romboutsia sp. 1001216sp1]MDB8810145.1 penicillin-binding protein 2 [Romboutsia sp. 1001216sp1]MDB8815892.1 penicillin-binding protein 2 [Romboutsia sp. 1001216sp1]MDB8818342.1 penicillin-binding protein 2 [Romboutsia sp. 1001216sp1]
MSRKKYNLPKTMVGRGKTTVLIFVLVYLFLIYRLADIQILKSDEYKQRQENQSTEKIDLNTGRGVIYDRNNQPLTDKKKETVLIVQKEKFINDSSIRNLVKEVSNLSDKEIYKEIEEQTESSIFEIQVNNISKKMEEKLLEKNIIVSKRSIRYDEDSLLSHTIGYINKKDKIGQYGIERSMDEVLNASNEEYISVFKVGEAGRKEGLDVLKGSIKTVTKDDKDKHIKLTIDKNIQKIVEKVVDKEANPTAVIISDVESGEILSMSSRPNFDQNDIGKYISDTDKSKGELRNRVIQNTYAPGSVFKIVTLYAALDTKIIDENYTYNCTGNTKIGKNKEILNCHNKEGHGIQSLTEAFANSCNTAFFDIANKVGKSKIIEYAKKLHLDEKLDIGLEEEVNREIPKDISIRNLAIGQGSMEFTPIQINQMTQIIANNGTYKPLYIYDSIVDNNKGILKNFNQSKEDEIISPYTLTIVKDMMKKVSLSGTGEALKDLEGGCGVKTGTAQTNIDGISVNNGWITGFYPSDTPKYTITVIVEGTKEESKSALPIFKEICTNLKYK